MLRTFLTAAFLFTICAPGLQAQDSASAAKKPAAQPGQDAPGKDATKSPAKPKKKAPKGLLRLTPDYDIYLDLKRKMLVVDGEICLREGQLEMFACPRGTKEHESVLSLNCRSRYVHAGLLALKAVPKHPVRFRPKYVPASGTTVDILVMWNDRQGKPRLVRAQEMIKNLRTGKALEHDFVFGGSGFWVDEETGEKYYHADGGELVCVSNFPTATMDLPIKSSQANSELLYAANTKNIPAVGTKIRVLFIPRVAAARKAPKQGVGKAGLPADTALQRKTDTKKK